MITPHRRFKDTIYEQLARVGKALSAPKRLELLDLLCQGPRTVEALADQAALSIANASQHLQVLRAARLAESRLAEVEQATRTYLEARGAMEPVAGDELLRRVRNGDVTVLDVRPAE